MATEFITTQSGNTNKTFNYGAIETIDITDLKVTLNGVLQTLTTQYSVDEATSTVTFVTAPSDGDLVRIFRDTPIDQAKAVLSPGSSIRAQNLNDNAEQALFSLEEIKEQYVTTSSGTFESNVDLNNYKIVNLANPTNPQDAVTKQYLEDNYFDDDVETIQSGEAWPDNNTTIATTAAIDDRVDSKIDSAITGDIAALTETGIQVANDGDGTITLSLIDGGVPLDRIEDDAIIIESEQDGGEAVADTKLFSSSAAAKRFDTLISLTTPAGSNWQEGKTWYQDDTDKTLYIWNPDLNAGAGGWDAITSGGTFTELEKVIYVDSVNGNDSNDGHRISAPKQTIKAAITAINDDDDYGDGSVVLVAPGVYQEVAPIQIEKRDVSIIGQALRSCIVHPTELTETNTLFEVNSGTYLSNLTFTGIKATGVRGDNTGGTNVDPDATYGLPEDQGWNVAFYPGADPANPTTLIYKSPYIQNCTNFSDSEIDNTNLDFFAGEEDKGKAGDEDSAVTGGGILIDGNSVANGSPLRSMVCDSYTHVGLDGPGILVTNNGYCQATSSYAFFCHYHIKCLNGGQANLAASTTDFGRYALIADGKSPNAIFTATVNGTHADGSETFNIDTPIAGATWFGSTEKPQDNMLVEVNGQTYPVLSSVVSTTGGAWTVTISRPDQNDLQTNLGLDGEVNNTHTAEFFLRSMVASSGHTMEYVGSGTNYSALPENGGVPVNASQKVELDAGTPVNNVTAFGGKVWAAITDHRGNFSVGDTFSVDQQTGFVTIPTSASDAVKKTAVTGSALLPVGTTAQRDSVPAAGMIRYNTSTAGFEGYGSEWGAIGGGATGGGSDAWALEHDNTITTSYTIGTNKNVISAGPLTVNSGATVTVPSGSNWVIV